jgi:hypothetical protein
MSTTPEEKVWSVVKEIADGCEIAPSGGTLFLDPGSLVVTVNDLELSQILDRLARDEKIITITHRPEDMGIGKEVGRYCIDIPDPGAFREFLNRAHARHSGDIDRMEANNFLAVSDVAMDILAALQIKNDEEVFIPLMPDVVRFHALFPGEGVNMRDRYCDYRWKAFGYLKDRKHITDFSIVRDDMVSRWNQKVKVIVDRYDFDKFYDKLEKVFQRRVTDPAQKEAKSKKRDVPAVAPIEKPVRLPAELKVHIKDRQISVGDFILSKPHAVGGNKGFFEYVYENANQPLEREKMPDYVTLDIKGKGFSKVLNELGFKGEILKAFCPERGKSRLLFRKEVTTEQLENDGINLELLLQELQIAHTKNSPK